MTRVLVPRPLAAEAFAPYGEVIEPAGAEAVLTINYGWTTRFDDLAALDVTQGGGRAILSLFRSRPLPSPVTIKVMERHPLGSQAFIPLSAHPFLVVVAPPGPLDLEAIVAFRTAPGQGVNYRAGTWHHFSLALEAESDFLVIDRAGPGENLDEVFLNDAQVLSIDG